MLKRSNVAVLIKEYLDYLNITRNYSQNTIISYKTDLKQFYNFLVLTFHGEDKLRDDVNLRIDINSIDLLILKSFISDLFERKKLDIKNARKFSNRSLSRKISVLKSLFKYLYRKGIIKSNPASGLGFPKIAKKLPSYLSVNELNTLRRGTRWHVRAGGSHFA